jgi:hypothetical protein
LRYASNPRGSATIAFSDVELASGMVVRGPRLMRGKHWPLLGWPSYRMRGKHGVSKSNVVGRQICDKAIEFRDRPTRDQYTTAIIELIRSARPTVLADAGTRRGALDPP